MTDGPFKNLKLGSCWKRLAEAVQNDAASLADCGAFASDALARHLVTTEHAKALQELDAHIARGQLELDPLGSIEAIFDHCDKTPFLEVLQKELLFRAANDTPLGDAIAPALDAAIDTQIGEARNRFQEECIRAQEAGELSRSAADRVREKIDSAFDAVESAKVCDALLSGKKDAFEKDLGRSDGVDEGMVRL
ncbi:hypothetical protein [Paradevosia shaoguanensis]|uniref:Uncharacterized protein n=1 Tax=Paradevosia shaoguanensis TaxID=1335043 RepID=A0AA41QLS9_9HYPH|nr:hypothetical protein [Paradevosia shaoguanensis]MCF1742045.1 hypothetical protein [Paradevosia shaoguanensis]MCI0126528.1 hypothetical protein [Paradevosia shaoguanensis]